MRFCFLTLLISIIGCKQPEAKQRVISPIHTSIPEGAMIADFLGNQDSLYAYVKEIDFPNQTTYIGFEDDRMPNISIPESIGAKLQVLKLNNFSQEVLLINATPVDTNFNEYYLFVWNDSLWTEPVNRFDIHKSNMSDTLTVLTDDPRDSTKILRYYSVFDMDSKSEKKYSWKLMRESVVIEK